MRKSLALDISQLFEDYSNTENLLLLLLCIARTSSWVSESERMRMKKLEELNTTVDSFD